MGSRSGEARLVLRRLGRQARVLISARFFFTELTGDEESEIISANGDG
jgi:hypothetical protein